MKYKLFIADYDGTLGGFEGINSETVDAIKEYEKKGGKFAVCTGRMFKNIRDICETIPLLPLPSLSYSIHIYIFVTEFNFFNV